MGLIHAGRYRAKIEGDFVIFIIGMRPNRPWKMRTWGWIAQSMGEMLRVLREHKHKGLLSVRGAITLDGPLVIQYWRSREDLYRFAENPEDPHLGPWRRYNKEVRDTGDVGIWHETYEVKAGAYHSVYVNMPRFGLAAAGEHIAAGKGRSPAKHDGAARPRHDG
ncbi:DUF4188 domain-containing protein [Sorangium sp. So ce131]|uniref:DUF4188 domain-containing protein n=1 Tax=Sorangium sp. So ce131 TaxID=3133282 RepID=UPI003F6419DF